MDSELIPTTIEQFPGNLPVDCLEVKAGSFVIEGIVVRFAGMCRTTDCPVVATCSQANGVNIIGECVWQSNPVQPE
jgi:hypothetical protein